MPSPPKISVLSESETPSELFETDSSQQPNQDNDNPDKEPNNQSRGEQLSLKDALETTQTHINTHNEIKQKPLSARNTKSKFPLTRPAMSETNTADIELDSPNSFGCMADLGKRFYGKNVIKRDIALVHISNIKTNSKIRRETLGPGATHNALVGNKTPRPGSYLASPNTPRLRELDLAEPLPVPLLSEEQYRKLQSNVPIKFLAPVTSECFLATVSGPNYDENVRRYQDIVAAQAISTYPVFEETGRAGEPICDYYYVRLFERAIVLALADGCNWGEAPKQAARRASVSFVRYLQDNLENCYTTQHLVHYILDGFLVAHHSISEGYTNLWAAGTATLLGGVLLPLETGNLDLTNLSATSPRSLTTKSYTHGSDDQNPTVEDLLKNDSPRSGKPSTVEELELPLEQSQPRQPKLRSHMRRRVAVDTGEIDYKSLVSNAEVANRPANARLSVSQDLDLKLTESEDAILMRKKKARNPRRFSATTGPLDSVPESKGLGASRNPIDSHFSSRTFSVRLDRKSEAIDEQITQWGFVFGNVGDCKVFVFHNQTETVVDLTPANRAIVTDPRDPGGRLGPYHKGGLPDFRNLCAALHVVQNDDIIIAVSDGIHDNFDPLLLGISPNDCGSDALNWEELDLVEAEKVKTAFRERKLCEMVLKANKSPVTICNVLMDYSRETTENSRDFMVNSPSLELPDDYTKYPGKMDHASCICVKVGTPGDASLARLRTAVSKRESWNTNGSVSSLPRTPQVRAKAH